jgi:hypothetical protein
MVKLMAFEVPPPEAGLVTVANFAGVSRPWFGLFDYRGWPRCRLHSPRAERMRENIAVTPSA